MGFGALADRALLGQVRAAREAAASQADETARLTALSVRAALAQLEQALAAGHPPAEVAVEQLPKVLSRSALLARKPYSQRPRAELAKLLRSTEATEQGLPEAVVARLALGDEARVVGAADEASTVAERLMSHARGVRTTLDIDDDVLLAARELAGNRRKTTGKILSDLARQALQRSGRPSVRNGVRLLARRPSGAKATIDLVNRLRDER